MNILFLLSRVPYPLEKGDKLRAFNQIKNLSKEHDITLCCLNDKKLHPKAIEKLRPYCSSIHIYELSKFSIFINLCKAFFSGKPFNVGYFFNKKIQKRIHHLINELSPDHIFCQLLRTTEYVKGLEIKKTLDYQDVFSTGIKRRLPHVFPLLRPIFINEYHRLLKYEKDIFDYFDNKIIISIPDRDLIPHPDKKQITVVPNGIDLEFFSSFEKEKTYDILFTGNMGYPPNANSAEYLAKKIFPLLIEKYPDIRLLIAGASPSKKTRSLASDNIEISGWVDDIRSCYAESKIFVAPMQIGTGMQNKLLEAMAMKIPCVTSSLANKALGAKENEEILIGNKPDEYAKHIISLLEDKDKYCKIADRGYKYVNSNFSWKKQTNDLKKLITNRNN